MSGRNVGVCTRGLDPRPAHARVKPVGVYKIHVRVTGKRALPHELQASLLYLFQQQIYNGSRYVGGLVSSFQPC
jgi:hypothetical protein